MKRTVSKRFDEAIKGIKRMSRPRGISLPKVSRARGSFTLLNRPRLRLRRGHKAAEVKKRLSAMGRERKAAPDVPPRLEKLLASDDDEFVLWLGPDFTKSASLPGTDLTHDGHAGELELAQVYSEIAKGLDDAEKRQELENILDELAATSGEEMPSKDMAKALFTAESMLIEALGSKLFYRVLSQALNARFEKLFTTPEGNLNVDELAYKMVRALKPKCVIYTGYDRMLEKQFAHDNITVTSLTLLDMQASKFTANSLDVVAARKQVILKLQGDVDQPQSIPFLKEDIFSQYGLKPDGSKCDDDEMLSSAVYMRAFLKEIVDKYSVVFVGSSLNKDEPLAHLLAEFQAEKTPVKEAEKEGKAAEAEGDKAGEATDDAAETAAEAPVLAKHFALVTVVENKEAPKRFESEEVDVEYILYTPDDEQTQVMEFLASMTTIACKAIPDEIPSHAIFMKGFAASLSYDKFLTGVTKKEQEAKTLCFFANYLERCDLVSEESYREKVVIPDIEQRFKDVKDGAELIRKVLEAYSAREAALFEKLTSTDVKQKSLVKLLLPKKAVDSELALLTAKAKEEEKDAADLIMKKYEKLLEVVEASQGKLQVRLAEFENGDTNGQVTNDFSLLFLGAKGFGEVAMLKENPRAHFSMNWFEVNTNKTEETVLLFERMWHVADGEGDSLEYIKQNIEKLKSGEVAPEKEEEEEEPVDKKEAKKAAKREKAKQKAAKKAAKAAKKEEAKNQANPEAKSAGTAKVVTATAVAKAEKVEEKPEEKKAEAKKPAQEEESAKPAKKKATAAAAKATDKKAKKKAAEKKEAEATATPATKGADKKAKKKAAKAAEKKEVAAVATPVAAAKATDKKAKKKAAKAEKAAKAAEKKEAEAAATPATKGADKKAKKKATKAAEKKEVAVATPVAAAKATDKKAKKKAAKAEKAAKAAEKKEAATTPVAAAKATDKKAKKKAAKAEKAAKAAEKKEAEAAATPATKGADKKAKKKAAKAAEKKEVAVATPVAAAKATDKKAKKKAAKAEKAAKAAEKKEAEAAATPATKGADKKAKKKATKGAEKKEVAVATPVAAAKATDKKAKKKAAKAEKAAKAAEKKAEKEEPAKAAAADTKPAKKGKGAKAAKPAKGGKAAKKAAAAAEKKVEAAAETKEEVKAETK